MLKMTNQTNSGAPGQKGKNRLLSLWDVLTFLSGAVAVGNSWAAAKVHRSSSAGTAGALLIGCCVGAGCILLIRVLGSAFINKFGLRGDLSVEQRRSLRWALVALYVFSVVWLVASGVIGYQVTAYVIQLF
jgi:hypothetical protein